MFSQQNYHYVVCSWGSRVSRPVCVCETEPETSVLLENQRWVCWLVSTHSQWPVACNRAPTVSLSVFLLITHHSSRGKAPHKLQRIVSCRSACHHAAPCFRTRLIVDGEQCLAHTRMHAHKTFMRPHSHTHAHTGQAH